MRKRYIRMFCIRYFGLYLHITSLTESFRMVHVNQCLVNSESRKLKRNLVSQYFTKSGSSSDAAESDSKMSESPLSSGSEKKIRIKKWQSVPQRQNPSARIPHTLFLRDNFRSGSSVFLSHFHTDHMKGLTKKFVGHIFGTFCDCHSILKPHPQHAIWLPTNSPSLERFCILYASENIITSQTAQPNTFP